MNSALDDTLSRYNFSLPHAVQEYQRSYRDHLSRVLLGPGFGRWARVQMVNGGAGENLNGPESDIAR